MATTQLVTSRQQHYGGENKWSEIKEPRKLMDWNILDWKMTDKLKKYWSLEKWPKKIKTKLLYLVWNKQNSIWIMDNQTETIQIVSHLVTWLAPHTLNSVISDVLWSVLWCFAVSCGFRPRPSLTADMPSTGRWWHTVGLLLLLQLNSTPQETTDAGVYISMSTSIF